MYQDPEDVRSHRDSACHFRTDPSGHKEIFRETWMPSLLPGERSLYAWFPQTFPGV